MKHFTFLIAMLALTQTMEAKIGDFKNVMMPMQTHNVQMEEQRTLPKANLPKMESLSSQAINLLSPDHIQKVNAMSAPRQASSLKHMERMDSCVTTDNYGLYKKQVYTWNNYGQCVAITESMYNTVLNTWSPIAWAEYAYDKAGRTTLASIKEQGDEDNSYKYTYTYDGQGNNVCKDFYTYNEEDDVFTPSQRGEYTYDANGKVTVAKYYSWDEKSNKWVYAQKETQTYDANGWVTSYFGYTIDENGNELPVVENGGRKYFEAVYTPWGADKVVTYYRAEDGKWLAWTKFEYEYDDNRNNTYMGWLVWNRANQQWGSGDYYQTRNGSLYSNSGKYYYTYDANNRMTKFEHEEYLESGQWQYNYLETRSYKMVEDTLYRNDTIYNYDKEHNLYPVSTDRYGTLLNPNGTTSWIYEYSASYDNNTKVWMPKLETVRHTIKSTGLYLGTESYGFTNNRRRYASSREWFDYESEDYNAQPIHGHHWKGNSSGTDTDWNDYSDEIYGYEDGDKFTEFTQYKYVNDQPLLYYGWKLGYDWEKGPNEVLIAPLTNTNQYFFNYKMLFTIKTTNYGFDSGIEDNYVTDARYYYSDVDVEATKIQNCVMDKDDIVGIYDLSGVKHSTLQKGINVIRHKSGMVEKRIVK